MHRLRNQPSQLVGGRTPRILLARTQGVVATHAVLATTFLARAKGFLGRDHIAAGEALVFPSCRSIHTLGMGCVIDAVFVDRQWRIVALRPTLRPWRWIPTVWNAWGVIELAAGTIARADLRVGDQLEYEAS